MSTYHSRDHFELDDLYFGSIVQRQRSVRRKISSREHEELPVHVDSAAFHRSTTFGSSISALRECDIRSETSVLSEIREMT